MWGWFAPRCPLPLPEKVWTEQRFQWIVQQFGLEALRAHRVILPTREFFPTPFDATDDGLLVLFRQVCELLQISAERYCVVPVGPSPSLGYLGLYVGGSPCEIRINREGYGEEEQLIATLVHELSHDFLLGRGLLRGDESDHEWITDLYLSFAGFGIFHANTAVKFRSQTTGNWSWWTMSKRGYIPARLTGYAMALAAWLKRELNPPWLNWLTADGREVAQEGLRFLDKTGDCLFDRFTVAERPPTRSMSDWLAVLSHAKWNGQKLVALHSLRDASDSAASVLPAVNDVARHGDPYLRGEAVLTLGYIASADTELLSTMLDALGDSDHYVRRCGALGFGLLGKRITLPAAVAEEAVQMLRRLMPEADDALAFAAVSTLRNFRNQAMAARGVVVQSLVRWARDEKHNLCQAALMTLESMQPNVAEWLPQETADLPPQVQYSLKIALRDFSRWGNVDEPIAVVPRLPATWQQHVL